MSDHLGFSISANCFGPGLRINHFGLLIVNSQCHIGKWCDIHQGVNLGDNGEVVGGKYISAVPTIGDFCFIGPGAKIFGKITVGNEVRIGANCVVNKSIGDKMSVKGIPAIASPNRKELSTIACSSFEAMFLKSYPQYIGKI
ncbi:MAG: hypothetical protein J6T94_09165 [Bacteroidaceae bacterium]|nr:hypothetical protein [Bacteroidaceae bacterium]